MSYKGVEDYFGNFVDSDIYSQSYTDTFSKLHGHYILKATCDEIAPARDNVTGLQLPGHHDIENPYQFRAGFK